MENKTNEYQNFIAELESLSLVKDVDYILRKELTLGTRDILKWFDSQLGEPTKYNFVTGEISWVTPNYSLELYITVNNDEIWVKLLDNNSWLCYFATFIVSGFNENSKAKIINDIAHYCSLYSKVELMKLMSQEPIDIDSLIRNKIENMEILNEKIEKQLFKVAKAIMELNELSETEPIDIPTKKRYQSFLHNLLFAEATTKEKLWMEF